MADISKIKTPVGDTYDISVSRNKVGKDSDHWEGGLDPVSQAMILDHSANKTFGLPASQITIEYSTDDGATWVDYGATDTQKKDLFSETRRTSFYLGKNPTGKIATTSHRLRVTIAHNAERYVALSAVYVWLSTDGNTIYMDMEKSTNDSPNSFTTVFSGQLIKGWPGANIRYFPPIYFGNNRSNSANANKIRLTFYQTAVNADYGASNVYDIRFYGNAVWTKANSMMATNHMYSWDADMNVTFPAKVTATEFDGSATFTSSDVADGGASSWTTVTKVASGEKHSSLFAKMSQMFKNIRYLYKLLGTTDISSIGDGTVTGGLSSLNDSLTNYFFGNVLLSTEQYEFTAGQTTRLRFRGADIRETTTTAHYYLIFLKLSSGDKSLLVNIRMNQTEFSCDTVYNTTGLRISATNARYLVATADASVNGRGLIIQYN